MSGKFDKKSVLFIPANFKEGDIDILSAVTVHSFFRSGDSGTYSSVVTGSCVCATVVLAMLAS